MDQKHRANSTPELASRDYRSIYPHEDSTPLEGLAAEVKLLLKLIQEHNASLTLGGADARRPKRVATMLTILDDVRSRVQKAQSSMPKRKAELRRCTTDIHRNSKDPTTPSPPPTKTEKEKDKESEKKPPISPLRGSGGFEEQQPSLRRQLSANMTARKGLEKMFCSLSKEKETIAVELSKRVKEAEYMEEMLSDLRAQNEKLMEKAKVCLAQHQGGDSGCCSDGAMQERNKELTEQLMKSLEGHRMLKKRLKELIEERERINGRIAEVAMDAAAGVEWVRRLREKFGNGGGSTGREAGGDGGVAEELQMLERVLAGFYRKLLSAAVPRAAISLRDSPVRGSPRGSPTRD